MTATRRRLRHLIAAGSAASTVAIVAAVAPVAPVAASGSSTPVPVVVQSGQTNASRWIGPKQFGASFGAPTRRGDLLVASVICGVIVGGMPQAVLSLPSGWRRAVSHIGGIEGGLQAAIYYFPDNPGGIQTFGVGTVPADSEEYCTTFWVELSGIRGPVGTDTSGSNSSDEGWGIAVHTATRTQHTGDLVLMASTDGNEDQDGDVYTIPRDFHLLLQQDAGHVAQPGTLSDRVAVNRGVQGGTISWNGGSTDNCAVIVALST